MPIDSLHPKYIARHPQWRKCRDAFEGEDAIKAAGVLYLPKLKGQSDEDYKAYKNRALFYSITAKSISALVGMATSKEPKLKFTESMNVYFNDSQMVQFSEIYSLVLSETLLQSRCGVLVDLPADGGKPYPAVYQTEDIINWRIDEGGKLRLVVLREEFYEEIDDYTSQSAVQYRELRLTDDGIYTQRIYDSKGEFKSEPTPTIRGLPLDHIPFYVTNPIGTGFADHKPMMLDIANINISHYLSSADLEHGRHFTGLPTPVIIGADSNTDLYIGSTKFLVIPDKGGDAKYLEFTGQGLQSLEKAMTEKQSLLASMSARLLDNSSRGSEAADAVKLRYMSETASLATVVKSISVVLNSAYKLIAEILGEDREAFDLMLDTDFMETTISAAEMTALFNGFFTGAITKETLVYNMRKGRRLDPLRSDEEELAAIDKLIAEAKEARKTEQSKNQPAPSNQPTNPEM